jgi:hypothetical protein
VLTVWLVAVLAVLLLSTKGDLFLGPALPATERGTSLPDHKKESGKHRDPMNRRRSYNDSPEPEVLGVPIVAKLQKDRKIRYGKAQREA